MKYISQEEAKRAIREAFKDLPLRVGINTIINSMPTVDLITCGECKYHDEDGWGYGNCQRPSVDYLRTADDDFCSYGERRADEHSV